MKNNFDKFDSIEYEPLRVFNRVVLMSNIMADFGKDAAKQYAELFDENERKEMYLVQMLVKQKGVAEVRKELTRGLEVVYDSEQDDA